jgi:hypothetical protein
MEQFARIVIGYHGCSQEFARDLLLGTKPVRDWKPSTNDWDWLGHGIYFWEHAPERAQRWAQEHGARKSFTPAVIGAVIQLGRCFDLLNEAITQLLGQSYQELAQTYDAGGFPLPKNRGREHKRRELDCLVINYCLDRLQARGVLYDTVRGAFLEGGKCLPGCRLFPGVPYPNCRAQSGLHSRRILATLLVWNDFLPPKSWPKKPGGLWRPRR